MPHDPQPSDVTRMTARYLSELTIPTQSTAAVRAPLLVDLAHEATLYGFEAEPLTGLSINGS